MSKNIVVYFSVSGVTARTAKMVAEAAEAELCQIVPEVPYTVADIDWTKKESRSTVEMQDLNCRPAISGECPDLTGYNKVYLGFPIWWGREPSIVDTFLDSAKLNGVTLVPFCTSGGSDIEAAKARITELTAGKANVVSGARFSADATADDIKNCL